MASLKCCIANWSKECLPSCCTGWLLPLPPLPNPSPAEEWPESSWWWGWGEDVGWGEDAGCGEEVGCGDDDCGCVQVTVEPPPPLPS